MRGTRLLPGLWIAALGCSAELAPVGSENSVVAVRGDRNGCLREDFTFDQ
jgi:hypothetical protein